MTFFDANDYSQEDKKFEQVPAGKYKFCIIDANLRNNKNSQGRHWNLKLAITSEGPQKDRLVFQSFTWENPSEAAVRIGRGQLSQLCKAVGVTKADSPEELSSGLGGREFLGELKYDAKGYSNIVNIKQAYAQQKSMSTSKPSEEDVPW